MQLSPKKERSAPKKRSITPQQFHILFILLQNLHYAEDPRHISTFKRNGKFSVVGESNHFMVTYDKLEDAYYPFHMLNNPSHTQKKHALGNILDQLVDGLTRGGLADWVKFDAEWGRAVWITQAGVNAFFRFAFRITPIEAVRSQILPALIGLQNSIPITFIEAGEEINTVKLGDIDYNFDYVVDLPSAPPQRTVIRVVEGYHPASSMLLKSLGAYPSLAEHRFFEGFRQNLIDTKALILLTVRVPIDYKLVLIFTGGRPDNDVQRDILKAIMMPTKYKGYADIVNSKLQQLRTMPRLKMVFALDFCSGPDMELDPSALQTAIREAILDHNNQSQ